MAQARDEAGNIWEVDAQGNPVRLIQAAGGPQMPADPTFPYQGAKAQADVANTQSTIADRAADNRRAEESLAIQRAAEVRAQAEWNAKFNPDGTPKVAPKRNSERTAQIKTVLDNIERLRSLSDKNLSVGSWSKYFQENPLLGQNRQNVEGAVDMVFGDLIQQQIAVLSEMNGGKGVATMANTQEEARRMAAAIANLSPDQSREEFLRGLKRAEDYYLRQAAQIEGTTPDDPRLAEQYQPSRKKDDNPLAAASREQPPGFADGGDGEKSIPIPQPMQDEHAAYLQQNWGRIQPEDYAAFRADLDGKYGFTPNTDAYLKVAPRLNERAMQGGKPDGLNIPPVNAAMDGQDQLNASLFNNKAGGFVFGAGDQLGVADELAGGFNSLVNGTSYDVEVARANAMKQAMQDAYPGMNLAGNVIGALATGAGAAKAFPALTGAITNTAPRAIAAGSGFGALSGAGEMNDSRVTGGLIGGGLGIAGGAAGATVAPLLSRAMGTQAGQAASRAGRSIWNHTGGKVMPSMAVSPAPMVPQFSKGEGLLPANVLESAIPNLQDADSLGLPYALADANPQLRMLAGSVSRRSADARQMAENIFEPRALGQADRATDAIDQYLAPQTNIGQRKNELLDAGNAASEPFYRMAEGVRTPVDPQLQALLRSSSGQDALGRAKSIMSDRGIPDTDKRIFLGPDNLLTTENTPAFQTLDYVKKGIDARLSEAKNPITGELDLRGNPALQAVEGWRKNYIGALDAINPDYAKARATYAPYAQRAEALERGYAAPATNVRPRDLQGAINRLGPEQMPEYQRGFATKLIDDTNATRFEGNPYTRIAGSPQQMEKLGMVFPDGADKFGRVAGLEKDMAKTAYETLGGSPTAMRQATDQQFDNGMMGLGTDLAADVAVAAGAFTLKNMIGKGVRAMGDTARLKGGKSKADAIAPVLFAPDPRMTLDYIADLTERQIQAAKRTGRYRRGAGLFGSILPSTFLGSE